MNSQIYIFDPTTNDTLSRTRGVGRYLQTIHENFDKEFIFINRINKVDRQGIFINPFFNLLSPPLLMSRVAKKQIAVIHDIIPLKYPDHFPIGIRGKINLFLNKLSLRAYDLVITDSEASKSDILKHFEIGENIVKVVYPTILKDYFAKIDTEETVLEYIKNPYYIYVGDATWNKNLVNIAKAVIKTGVKCVFAGSVFKRHMSPEELLNPWLKELIEFKKITQNNDNFIFPGFVSDINLKNLYRNALANILVSRDEGFGLSYVEAGACGTPTIAANTAVQQEIAGEAALFAEPESVEQIADSITSFINNKSLRSKITAAAEIRSGLYHPTLFRKNFLETVQY